MVAVKEKKAKIWHRSPLDWYVEPCRCTQQLLNREKFVGRIHDPSCGGGNIVRACLEAGYKATGTDVVDRTDLAPWFLGCLDFPEYDSRGRRPFDNIIMNPPFFRGEGTLAFIHKALSMTRGKVCAYTEARFLFGNGRAETLYTDRPPHRVYIVTPRPSCPTGEYIAAGGKVGGGTPDFIWLVWDNTCPLSGTSTFWLTSEDING